MMMMTFASGAAPIRLRAANIENRNGPDLVSGNGTEQEREMAKQQRTVWLAIEEAQSALAVLDSAISERLHADDRKEVDRLMEKARSALDKAQTHLSDALRDAQNAIDRI